MIILSASFSAAITIFRCALLAGEPVIFPTDTIYGIGAPLASIAANEKIFALKARPKGHPMPVLAGNNEQIHQLTGITNATLLAGHTTVLPASPAVDRLYTKEGTIAIRLVHGWLGAALALIGPVTATSVNYSGEAPLLEADEIVKNFSTKCKFMLWGASGNKASKIVDYTGKVIRE